MKWIALAMVLLSSAALSQERPKTLDEINRDDSFAEIFTLIDKAKMELETVSRVKRTDCMKAIGDEIFCECITGQTAVVLSFADYVSITTKTREQNGYPSLDQDMKQAYDTTLKARDECVHKAREK